MRKSLILSAMFAASLFAGGAFADRPGEDGGAPARIPHLAREIPARDLHETRQIREVREMRAEERRVVEVHERAPSVFDRARQQGDVIDRTGASHAVRTESAKDSNQVMMQSLGDREKARHVRDRAAEVQNCSGVTDDCQRTHAPSPAASEKAQKEDRDQIQRMVDRVRAERLLKQIKKEMCEKIASSCSENL